MQKNVIEYLEKTVQLFPNKIAYIDNNTSYTFSEIQTSAKKIASYVYNKYSVENKPIVVFLPKSAQALIGFHGITYSHNIYVPIDINQPINRIKSIFDVLKPALVITDERRAQLIEEIYEKEHIVLYNETQQTLINTNVIEKTLNKQISTDPLYILFTSGSTGTPKGVCINHQSVIDYIDWLQDTFSFNSNDIFANQAPLFFDNSILDIYSVLKNGASLLLIPERYFAFPTDLIELLIKYKVTVLFWVPSALVNLANSGVLQDNNLFLKKVLFCGEVMPNKQLNIWRKHYPDLLYANLYGPTEITDVCTYYIVNREFNDDEPLPIGFPCKNTDILILNEDGSLAKQGELGEICVRGISLANGYYNNPDKTSEVFIQNPLNQHYPELIYKTGDIGFINEYGELIYSCRKDYQIKHNGYRIELGEIETAANSLPYISQACVIYNEKIILIYTSNNIIENNVIINDLVKLIPKYELPEHIVKIDKMPSTSNGKIDRLAIKKMILGE